ncbi:helix-turn-helix domain-containing protein [Nocardia nova]|uniref:helix-turn-helix domain-containing protein n=1 Tax=Nocardia nova TaxID=37330 RepID=UPI001896177E|nr:helix-turn-helix transcriptional regulator [Nocardia nova]MBF6150222.1 helix-turn-helix domain-containing protein [Nocardia nova]
MAQSPPRIAGIHLRRLAAELLSLREAAGLNRQQVQELTKINDVTLYRIEEAQTRPQQRTLLALMDLYKADQNQRDLLTRLLRDSARRGLVLPYHADLGEPYNVYIGLENEADELRAFEPLVVPGLLQTEDYARALITEIAPQTRPEALGSTVRSRLDRQQRLVGDDALKLWAIIDEPALHRVVGSPEITEAQLRRLIEAAAMPNITMQVIPFDSGGHPGMRGSFTLMHFADAEGPEVVYCDTTAGQIFVEDRAEIRGYTDQFARLAAVALSPAESARLVARLAQPAPRSYR